MNVGLAEAPVRRWAGGGEPPPATTPTTTRQRRPAGSSASTPRAMPVAQLTYLGLYALQHRGQESAGMAVSDGDTITVVKDMGLVSHVFDDRTLAPLQGHLAVGHVRYSTTGASNWGNAQPIYRETGDAGFVLGHNGNLTNTAALAEEAGILPGTVNSDSDVVAELIQHAMVAAGPGARSDGRDLERALVEVLPKLEGAFSLVLMDDSHVVGVRDPNGFRPLCLGRLDNGWVLSSETTGLDIVGAHFVRELDPGEIVVIDATGTRSLRPFPATADRAQALPVRVRVLRPPRQPPVRPDRAHRPPAHGRVAGRAGPAPGRHGRAGPGGDGHAGARVGHPGGRGLRPAQRHPVRPGPGAQPLHRPHVHRPGPGPAQPERAHEVQPHPGEHRRQAPGRDRRLHRAGHQHPGRGRHAAGGRGGRDPPAHLLAALPLALLLRHGHRHPGRADRRQPHRLGDPRLPGLRHPGLPRPRPAGHRHRRRQPGLLHRLPHRRLPGAGPRGAGSTTSCPSVDLVHPAVGETYAGAGVDIGAGEEAVERIKAAVRSTFRPEVIGDVGGFGGLFAFDPTRYTHPVLVAATDGVGTKAVVARLADRYDTIGIDLVAMSVDDIAAQGAEPLFFLDCISAGRIDPEPDGAAGRRRGHRAARRRAAP